jgi:hypothetical protein
VPIIPAPRMATRSGVNSGRQECGRPAARQERRPGYRSGVLVGV